MFRDLIKSDKNTYKIENNLGKRIYNLLVGHIDYYIYKTVLYSRYYNHYKKKNNLFMSIIYGRKYYKYSKKSNLELYSQMGNNIKIYHSNVVINTNSVIGNNVKFHGNNCIGNNGIDDKAPIIGNNVDIGFGACIIGDVEIADNIIIGANSIVTKSFKDSNVVIAGNPAKVIKRYNDIK